MQIELSIIDDDDADENQRWQVMRSLLNEVGLRDNFQEEFKEHRKDVVSLLQEAEFDYNLFYTKLSSSSLTPEGKKLLESDLMRKKVEKMCDDVRNILVDMPLEKRKTEGHKIVALTHIHIAGVAITDYAFLVTGSNSPNIFRLRTKTEAFKHSTEACQEVYNKLFPLTRKKHGVKMQEGAEKVRARIKVENSIFAFETQSPNPTFVGQIGNRLFPIIWKDNRVDTFLMLFFGLLAFLLFWRTPYLTTWVADSLAVLFGSWQHTDMVFESWINTTMAHKTYKIDSTYVSYIRSSLERLDTGFWVAFIMALINLITKTSQLYWGKEIKWKLYD
jgi:hypothetical protein